MLKSMSGTILDTRSFFNRRETPAMHVGYLLGKPLATPMFGSMRVIPYDKRFSTILINLNMRNANILNFVAFSCETKPVNLTDIMEALGTFVAIYEEKDNRTRLEWTNFEETEAISSVFATIEGYKMENHEDGLLLYQADGSTIVVPFAELMLPGFTFNFKEFERPADKLNRNPVIHR